MTNPDNLISFHGLTIRPYGSYKGVPVRVLLNPDTAWSLKQASAEAHCSIGEMCRAIIMHWVSDHNDLNDKKAPHPNG